MPQNIKRNAILNISTNGVTAFTHGFHKYPAKFIPLIPRWAIKKYLNGSKNKTILDPFCGSGTTLVEGILAGHNAIGFDIDPLSSMISKAKTTRVDVIGLNEVANWLINGIKNRKKGLFKPDCETIEHWFTDDAIRKLSIIRTLINQIPDKFGTDKKTKDIQKLLLICFSSIIRRVSNADDESQKTYVSHTKIKEPEEVFALFLSQLNLFIERISRFSEITDPKLTSKVVCSSSIQSLTKKITKQTIDLAVTSPPIH
ncbi:MAG: DNA methyltransferase [Candidatus Omnitrophota bacterium]